jgi:hypothetical protein
MLKWISSIFKNKKLEELNKENTELKLKLVEKQEVINQTNAYWKKKMYAVKKHTKYPQQK